MQHIYVACYNHMAVYKTQRLNNCHSIELCVLGREYQYIYSHLVLLYNCCTEQTRCRVGCSQQVKDPFFTKLPTTRLVLSTFHEQHLASHFKI